MAGRIVPHFRILEELGVAFTDHRTCLTTERLKEYAHREGKV